MEIKSVELKESTVDMDGRTIEGYASTWERDQTGDVIHKGAFAKSINERFRAGRIKVLWQHAEPIGVPLEMREDDYGLFVKSRISKTRLGDEALELARDGVVDAMSIGFSVPTGKWDYDEESNTRHIREVKLFEYSLVTFPANEGALVTGIKQIEQALSRGTATPAQIEALVQALEDLKKSIAPEQKKEPSIDLSALDDLRAAVKSHKSRYNRQ